MFDTTNNLKALSFLANSNNEKPKKGLYVEDTNVFYPPNNIKQVAPAPPIAYGENMPFVTSQNGVVYECLKPMLLLERTVGIFPINVTLGSLAKVTLPLLIYSVILFLFIVLYIAYIKWDKVEIVRSAEGKFEEAVIDYLFTVYLVPVVIIPIAWYESKITASVFSEWIMFEKTYQKISGKKLPLFMGNKPLFVTLGLPLLSCGTMIVTHITMVNFRVIQVIPYCFINTITYLVGGMWYLHCDLIGHVATVLANDFETALHHIGPSVKVAEYRSLWMMLGKLTRSVGLGSCYVVTFLCLYLFLIITLTIYGLLSQIQDGLGVKDVGLTITAIFAIGLLYFVCDEAHYASNCVIMFRNL